jgi:C1A family cysteine protease
VGALAFRIASYHRVNSAFEVCAELAEDHPVAFGFDVPESFEWGSVGRTGIMHPPDPGERIVGGHAVLAIGYNEESNALLVRNSWGEGWGQRGLFWMPYELYDQLTRDGWAARA